MSLIWPVGERLLGAVVGGFERLFGRKPSLIGSVDVTSVNAINDTTGRTVDRIKGEPPRRLSISGLFDDLAPHRGAIAFVHTYAEDAETRALAVQLITQLNVAGWVAYESAQHVDDFSVKDVRVEVNAVETGRALKAATALLQALQAQAITCVLGRVESNTLPAAAMYVRIGPRAP